MKLTFTLGIIAVGIIIVLVVVSCKPKNVVLNPNDPTANAATCMPITIDPAFMKNNEEGKMVSIKTAAIIGDCLELTVNHGGGCPKRPDVYTLVWNKKILKSYPPQVVLSLHLNSDDVCKAMVLKNLKFDLKELQSANPKGEVFVRVKGWDEKLSYRFKTTEEK